jgi:hypothetical protein
MAPNRSAARPKGVPGVNALITTGALAAIVAGWATLSANTESPAPAQVVSAEPAVLVAPPPAWLLQAPSIAAMPEVATVRPAGDAPVLVARPQQVAPVAAAPAAAPAVAAAAPALREVAPQPTAQPAAPAAPQPVARSRSSR